MAVHTPDTSPKRGARSLYVLGLLAIAFGAVLMLLPELGRGMRPAGAAVLLLGAIVLGAYFVGKLRAEMHFDEPMLEPNWNKPAHGPTGYGARPLSFPLSAAVPAAPAEATALPSPTATLAAPSPTLPPVWGFELLGRISPQQFEAVCDALFAQGGFETRCRAHGPAGGVTVWLYSRHAQQGKDRPAAVALCRQWAGQLVGVVEMHLLLELMTARQLKRGTYATASSFTDNARQFASANGINALDGAGVLALIARRTPEQQRALLALTQRGS